MIRVLLVDDHFGPLGGELVVDAAPGKGFRVEGRVPRK